MSPLKTISKLTSIGLALSISLTTGVAQAATLGSTGTLRITDPSSFSRDYLGTGALSGIRLATGSGSQYNFNVNFDGNYTGVSMSGTVSIGEVDFAPTGGAQVDIVNNLNRAKIFKISNFTITNGSANTLDYTTSQNNARLFTFSNTFADFYLSQFYTVLDGQIGKINPSTGSLSCDQIRNFNIDMTGQGFYGNTVYAQRPLYANQTMLDTNCNFRGQVDNPINSYAQATNYNQVQGFINHLVLESGYTLKLTNSWNMLSTDSEVDLSDKDIENLVNVAIGKPIDDADNFGFKVFAIDPDTGVRGGEIQAQSVSTEKVPEPSTLFGLMAFGGLLASRFKKKPNN
jgi:hypothetical protein